MSKDCPNHPFDLLPDFPLQKPFILSGLQPWMEKLPEKLHIGKKVKIIKGKRVGEIGIVTDHWMNLDDCSGGYGNHLYQLEGDLEKFGCKNNSCAIRVQDCEIID